MTVLLHAASPDSLLLLLAADRAGLLPAGSERAVVLDSSTPGGRAVGSLLSRSTDSSADTSTPVPRPEQPLPWPAVDLATGAARTVAAMAPTAAVLDVVAAPATADLIATAAPAADLTVLDDGLGLLSPTPARFSGEASRRVTRIIAPPLIPGLDPVLLRETGAGLRPLPLEEIEAAAAWQWHPALTADRPLLVLGRRAPDLGRAIEAEREHLAARLVRAGLDVGARSIVLCQAAGQPLADVQALTGAAREAGLPLMCLPATVPAPVAHTVLNPVQTVSVDSPWLFFLRAQRGARVQSVATGRYLPRLAAATDPTRSRLAVVDALLRRGLPTPADEASLGVGRDTAAPAAPSTTPRGESRSEADQAPVLQRVADAVGYSIDPERIAALRETAIPTLLHEPALRDAYVPRARVKELRLLSAGTGASGAVRGAAARQKGAARSGAGAGAGAGARIPADPRGPGAGGREPAPVTQGLRVLTDLVVTGLLRRSPRLPGGNPRG